MRLGLDFCSFLCYNTRMITKTQITSGTEAILDLSTPVFVGDVDQGQALVMDDDGGEHWVSLDRLDPVSPLPAPTQKELDDEAFWDMEREERMSDFWSFFRNSLDNLTFFLIVLIMDNTNTYHVSGLFETGTETATFPRSREGLNEAYSFAHNAAAYVIRCGAEVVEEFDPWADDMRREMASNSFSR